MKKAASCEAAFGGMKADEDVRTPVAQTFQSPR